MPKFSIFYPIKPWTITQGFGVNGAYYQAHGINIIGHDGLDALASHGQPVYAAHDGVCYPEIDNNGGNGVVIHSLSQFDYNGQPAYFKSIYWHLTQDDAVVKTGQQVKAGDLIGYADSTGLSTGDHLHFSIKPENKDEPPFTWFNVEQNNGYLGNIDPTPYFNGLYAEDINKQLAPTPVEIPTRHTFYIPMQKGDSGPEVLALQRCLQSAGYFPNNVTPNGIYGPITVAAVFAFQKKNAITDVWSFIAIWSLMGTRVGPITLAALNRVFA